MWSWNSGIIFCCLYQSCLYGILMDRNRWHHFDESPVVFGIIKNVLTVNTAQHHTIDACSAWFSWLSWHNTKFKDYTKTLQRYNLLWEFTNFLEKKINDLSPLFLSPWFLQAKLQLKYSDLPVWQIAESLNFPNPSFFSKFFKRETGMTPNEFRLG